MKLTRNYVGVLSVPNGEVDISDPCYEDDTWCRINGVKVTPGTYNCYAYIGEDKNWGERVWIAQIAIADGDEAVVTEEKIKKGKSWRRIDGTVGVDAGLAGFFVSGQKPNFTDEEWEKLCDWMFEKSGMRNRDDTYIKEYGFWTCSGCGDGSYTAHAIRTNGKITALEIRF